MITIRRILTGFIRMFRAGVMFLSLPKATRIFLADEIEKLRLEKNISKRAAAAEEFRYRLMPRAINQHLLGPTTFVAPENREDHERAACIAFDALKGWTKTSGGAFWKSVLTDQSSGCPIFEAHAHGDKRRWSLILSGVRRFTRVLGIASEADLATFLSGESSPAQYTVEIFRTLELTESLLPRESPFRRATESWVGAPLALFHEDRIITGDLLRLSYYAEIFSNRARLDQPKRKVLLEVGAGFGLLPKLMLDVHTDRLTYVIVDLPEILAISTYYLAANFPKLRMLVYSEESPKGPWDRSLLLSYDVVVIPSTPGFSILAPDILDGVFNTSSMGEMEPEICRNYFQEIRRCTRGFFLYSNSPSIVRRVMGKEYRVGIDQLTDEFSPEYGWDIENDEILAVDSVRLGYRMFLAAKRQSNV